jgi:hypothetical protein
MVKTPKISQDQKKKNLGFFVTIITQLRYMVRAHQYFNIMLLEMLFHNYPLSLCMLKKNHDAI